MMDDMCRMILTREDWSIQMEACHSNVSNTNPTDRPRALLSATKITEGVSRRVKQKSATYLESLRVELGNRLSL
jgi:hypothetical protein